MNVKETLKFLNELSENNHKSWFDANRRRYEDVKEGFMEFTDKLIVGVAQFDARCEGLTRRDCTYRINRDIRFSNDKRPYKTHLGAYICPQGKKSGYAGYYFHLECLNRDYLSNNLLAVGAYCPDPRELDSIRTEIYDNPDLFLDNISAATGFALEEDKLKRVPKGYPVDFRLAEYLKQKSYCLMKPLDDSILFSDNLENYVLGEFEKGYGFCEMLNRAIQFAHEEM